MISEPTPWYERPVPKVILALLWIVLMVLLALFAASLVCGCAATREQVTAPSLRYEDVTTETRPDGTVVEHRKVREAVGAGYSGKNLKEFSGGELDLPMNGKDEHGTIGAATTKIQAQIKKHVPTILYVIGGIFFVGGVFWAVKFQQWTTGAAGTLAGLGLICTTYTIVEYPLVAVAFVLAIIMALGLLGYELWRSARRRAALAAVVPTVQGLDAPTLAVVAAGVKKRAGKQASRVKDEITLVKRRAGVA